MSRSPKRKLAASFVMTVSAIPAVASIEGCRKTTVEPDEPRDKSHYVYRSREQCFMGTPEHCPRGATCNPPAPPEIDCPPTHRDAGEPDPRPERPAGKERWLRVQPHLYASSQGCSYQPERFCSPPGTKIDCTPWPASVTVKCAPAGAGDGGADAGRNPRGPFALEAFTYKDGLGVCHKIPAFECNDYSCEKSMPAGEVTPCP